MSVKFELSFAIIPFMIGAIFMSFINTNVDYLTYIEQPFSWYSNGFFHFLYIYLLYSFDCTWYRRLLVSVLGFGIGIQLLMIILISGDLILVIPQLFVMAGIISPIVFKYEVNKRNIVVSSTLLIIGAVLQIFLTNMIK